VVYTENMHFSFELDLSVFNNVHLELKHILHVFL